jgi:hypothetical protein
LPNTIALIFDFDDTLAPDSTTRLLKHHGLDTNKFWNTLFRDLVQSGYDPAHAFLRLLLDHVGENKPLGLLTNSHLAEFGASLDDLFFPGIPQVFDDLRGIVAEFRDISIEFYIISGGLQALIEGSRIVQAYFTSVYGCQLDESGDPLRVTHIKRAVNFTEKTRYLFEINKGLQASQTTKNPYLVNEFKAEPLRRVPFSNMIYIGDGLTDIPCFSLLTKNRGTCFGVFDPSSPDKAKQALLKLLQPDRVIGTHFPRYGPEHELGVILRAKVGSLCSDIVVGPQTAQYGQA